MYKNLASQEPIGGNMGLKIKRGSKRREKEIDIEIELRIMNYE